MRSSKRSRRIEPILVASPPAEKIRCLDRCRVTSLRDDSRRNVTVDHAIHLFNDKGAGGPMRQVHRSQRTSYFTDLSRRSRAEPEAFVSYSSPPGHCKKPPCESGPAPGLSWRSTVVTTISHTSPTTSRPSRALIRRHTPPRAAACTIPFKTANSDFPTCGFREVEESAHDKPRKELQI
jgi:hypothetical protein